MHRITFYCLLIALACGTPLVAGHSSNNGHGRRNCTACNQCPRCHATCKLDVSKDDEKKHCWEVECKTICIPKVTFPWQMKKAGCKNCSEDKCACPVPARQCAKTKTIRVLMKREYTCPKCKYKWTPCNDCCQGNCADCCAGGTAMPAAPAVKPIEAQPPSPSDKDDAAQASKPSVPTVPPLLRR